MSKNTRGTILAAAVAGARAAAASPNIAIDPSAVGAVAERVARELEPVVDHATNNEKPIQSRVTIGNAVSILGTIALLFGSEIAPADQALIVDGISAAIALGGAVYSLYGRWKARKPLGA